MNQNADESFYQETRLVIDGTLDESVSELQKKLLMDSILRIFKEEVKRYILIIQSERQTQTFSSNQNFIQSLNSQQPFLNFFQPDFSPLNTPFPFNFGCQNQFYQIPSNSYLFSNTSNLMQIYQQPFLQQMNFGDQGQLSSMKSSKKVKNNSKDKKKKKESKGNKSTPKKEKKQSKSKKNKSSSKKGKEDSNIISFDYKDDNELNGIINYLTVKTHGNIHDNGTIELSCNSINPISMKTNYHPKFLLNSNNDLGYLSSCEYRNIWILFDFKQMQIEISCYTIRIGHRTINQIKDWNIEISNDKNNWQKIDSHSDYPGLTQNTTKTFNVEPNHFARYCRLNFEVKKNTNNRAIAFNAIEFYGKLKLEDK